eukprot:CAMPEP_0182532084 /NCGR_PEP_ID=MMETSP1323-20130603/10798_1 /TAXON_ID=236787 /ORGANISM="Florenciella parvula, Strain RCC1693" /LENGTH=495 /DNA_ID=CAMNT_0024741763 /DNA_START=180 /DNA_END=1666 /DNA_ORIENTATION=-
MSRFGFLLAATLVTSNAGLLGAVDPSSALEESVLRTQFEKFVADFNRVYKDDDEVAERYEIFKSNIELIAVRNAAEAAAGSTGTHGVTKFADLTQEEFASRYLKTITPEDLAASKAQPGMFEAEATNNSSNSRLRGRQLLATYDQDWTGVYTTAVKNQGYCGSCWAFSVVEQVESDSMRLLGENDDFILSPQELVSCDTSNGNAGCNGGWTTTAYDYIESSGGLVQETAYPYVSGATGTQYSCDTDAILNPLVTVTDYYQYYTESAMAQHVGQVGTLSIAIDASTWASYTSGVMSTCGTSIDHAVQITGVNTDSSNSMGDAYWLVRNSWGTDWGYSGYIYLSYGDNTCGITTIPTYTEVKLTGGTSVPTAAPTAGSGDLEHDQKFAQGDRGRDRPRRAIRGDDPRLSHRVRHLLVHLVLLQADPPPPPTPCPPCAESGTPELWRVPGHSGPGHPGLHADPAKCPACVRAVQRVEGGQDRSRVAAARRRRLGFRVH